MIPISLLLLPDGKLASPRWRPGDRRRRDRAAVRARDRSGAEGLPGLPPAYLTWRRHVRVTRLAVDPERGRGGSLSVLIGVACLVVRYRRGTEVVRRQLLWVVAAAAVIVVAVIPWALVAGTPLAVLFTIPLLPGAVAAGVLRHELLDIRLVVARGLTLRPALRARAGGVRRHW